MWFGRESQNEVGLPVPVVQGAAGQTKAGRAITLVVEWIIKAKALSLPPAPNRALMQNVHERRALLVALSYSEIRQRLVVE